MTTAKSDLIKGRWIRPQNDGNNGVDTELPLNVASELEELLAGRFRKRIAELAEIERRVEERIQWRWEQAEAAIRKFRDTSESKLAERLGEREASLEHDREKARGEGRALGFREGYEKGAREGRCIGFEQARLEGLAEGRRQGHREEVERLRQEVGDALRSLATAFEKIREDRRRLFAEAQTGLVDLAVEIAAKLVKREAGCNGDVVRRNVEKALELVSPRVSVILQLHPLDARIVEDALQEAPAWGGDASRIEIRPATGIARGGCRLLCGDGVVDLTMESQLELIQQALREGVEEQAALDLEPGGPSYKGQDRGAAT